MAFKDLMAKAQDLTGSASEVASKLIDDFNAALPTLRALGFSVKDVQFGMGLLPEIGAKLIASAADVDGKKLAALIEQKQEQKTLVAVLKALQASYQIRDQLGDLGLQGVEIDLKLGLPPHIGIGFVKGADTAAAA